MSFRREVHAKKSYSGTCLIVKKSLQLILLHIALLSTAMSHANSFSVIKIQPAQSKDDVSYPYYQDLLTRVLQRTEAHYGGASIIPVDVLFSQHRAFNTLKTGELDVFWAGTNPQREADFTPIRIPIFRGLLGYRVPVILRSRQQAFSQIKRPEQLKALTACQGSQWPDSDILEANGYKVERIAKFEVMYSMLKLGRCDYFPRGVNEVYAELLGADKSDLMAFDQLMLAYTFPMYFFVAKDNDVLAERITQGLELLVASGELQSFLEEHPATRHIFPLSRFKQSLIFELNNPLLPELTPIERHELWLPLKPIQ